MTAVRVDACVANAEGWCEQFTTLGQMAGGLALGRPSGWRSCPVAQAVPWPDPQRLHAVERRLSQLPPLVTPGAIRRLAGLLGPVTVGQGLVLQAGPCAESFRDDVSTVDRLRSLLTQMGEVIRDGSGQQVVLVGRLAGQYAKPRSAMTELVGGVELPVFRGHIVHDDAPDLKRRRPDPRRLLEAYWHSRRTARQVVGFDVHTSHEALLLEYEEALTRREHRDGYWYAGSAHLLWIGERTRDPSGAHVAYLSEVANPVACKLGPTATPDEVAELCDRLNPHRVPGRLTLITRLGSGRVEPVLPGLLEAVRAERQPVVWLCDPMHGNTSSGLGGKVRRYRDIVKELGATVEAHRAAGSSLGGLHLELTGDDVSECPDDDAMEAAGVSMSLCDPRLNPAQSLRLAGAAGALLRQAPSGEAVGEDGAA